MSLPRSLLARLKLDLAELHDLPYPGVSVFIDDANVRKLCLVLTPPSGPWMGLSLHFNVELPSNWPASPPRVRSSAGVDHPNVFGDYICCDLLKEHIELSDGYTGGYTPALTLRGLFLQFLTFFSSTKVEQDYGGDIVVGDTFNIVYLKDNDVIKRLLDHRGIYDGDARQDQYKKLYEADMSPEIIINTYTTTDGDVSQRTKRAMLETPAECRVHRFERRNPRWTHTFRSIQKFKCKACPYGSDSLPHFLEQAVIEGVNSSSILLVSPPICILNRLNDDVIYELGSRLPSESLLSFCQAYPRMRAVVESTHMLLQRELRCFFLRTPLSQSVLGVGVAFHRGARTLSSDFDWLSYEAFSKHGVRKSIEKRQFTFFLPLAFSTWHFERAKDKIWLSVIELEAAVRTAEIEMMQRSGRTSNRIVESPRYRHECVSVIYGMMNNIVVSLVKSCDDVLESPGGKASATLMHASERAVTAYCHLFHLLVCLSRSTPAILHDATLRLRRFVTDPNSRLKTELPDIGELIVVMTLVLAMPPIPGTPITWKGHLNGPLLQEVIIRNARWVLKGAPELEYMERGTSDYRLEMTFTHSRTSLRLIMFQIAFLDIFVKAYVTDLSRLDENYGFPDKEIPERIVQDIKQIYQVSTWPAFFERVQYAKGRAYGKDVFSALLREAMKTSAKRGYHTRTRHMQRLISHRELAEREWRQRRQSVLTRPIIARTV